MRNWFAGPMIVPLAVVVLALTVVAQQESQVRGAKSGFVAAGVPEMPNPPGPAPKDDITGAWVGPIRTVMGPYPQMTPAGEAAFKRNRPVPGAGQRNQNATDELATTNDPFVLCDPLGFPRDLLNHAVSMRGGILFEPVSGRMLILFEQQRVWREVWMDGRTLPEKVDTRGYPDSRYYGYSVGHWDGGKTFVIDTTGLDPRTWLEERGHPHTNAAHVQERWTRIDQYHLEATVTVDDPKYYAKPFQLMKTDYYWKQDQDFEETLCIPSEAIEYRDKLARPAGWAASPSDPK